MPVKETMPATNLEIPTWSGEGDELHWKGCVYSLADFLVIREVIRELWMFFERYPNVTGVEREEYFLFALRRIQFLKAKLIPICMEAFMESGRLSVNILSFRECLDERHAETAKCNLKKIHDLLCLDELFKKH